MKKLIVLLCLLGISLTGFSQSSTVTYTYYKVKVGHGVEFYTAVENHVNKYRKLGSPYEVSVLHITGGKHHGEYQFNSRYGLSWTEVAAAPSTTLEMKNDWARNVAPHIEAVTGGGISSYAPKVSNTTLKSSDTNPNRIIKTFVYTLKFAPPKEFWDVIAKFTKNWDKRGHSVVVLNSTTGPTTISFHRRLKTGLKELEGPNAIKDVWEELNGKDSFDKDMGIMRDYISEMDSFIATRQGDLSSK
jgi:hypothetical protein